MNEKRHLGFTAIMAALILAFALVVAPVCAEEKKADAGNMEILREKIQAILQYELADSIPLVK